MKGQDFREVPDFSVIVFSLLHTHCIVCLKNELLWMLCVILKGFFPPYKMLMWQNEHSVLIHPPVRSERILK